MHNTADKPAALIFMQKYQFLYTIQFISQQL